MTTLKHNLIDTNVIIHFPSVFTNIKNIHVHLKTVEELDRLKESDNAELAYRARKGAKLISANLKNITIERYTYRQELVDDVLLKCAKKNNFVLITNDLTLELKCKFNKVESQPYTNGEKTNYSGIVNLPFINQKATDEYISKQSNVDKYHENEYLIFKNRNKPIVNFDGTEDFESPVQYIKKNGRFIKIKDHSIYNSFNKKIVARNIEQKCLLNTLTDKNISIVCITGNYGSGKSYLAINYAFEQLEKGFIDKIVYVPNNSITANSREVAAMPGGLFEKEIIFMGSLVDIVGYDEVERRIQEGRIEIMPISLARGRNIENAIVLVNEAQNLTEEHVKLLIGRIGENTKIIFDGDIHQTDRPIFKNSNGLKLLYKIKDSEFADLFSAVKLKTIERSRTAQVSGFLDMID